MVIAMDRPQQTVSALVVENDPEVLARITRILKENGIEVRACSSLDQGREYFNSQPIVVARAQADRSELNGFVDWVRERAGQDQPYIVAISDEGDDEDADRMDVAIANPGCDAVMQAPVDERQIQERLQAIDQWLRKRRGESATASAAEGKKADVLEEIELEEELGEEVVGVVSTDESKKEQGIGGLASLLEESGGVTPQVVRGKQFAPGAEDAGEVSGDSTSEHYKVMLESAPLAMAMFDEKLKYLVANDRWRELFHLENVTLVGRSQFEVFPNLPKAWREIYERALQGHTERSNEDLFERPDGTSDWVRWEVRPWKRGDKIEGVLVSCEVITAFRQERRRQEFEGEFTKSVLENGTAPVLMVDLTGRVVRQNGASRSLFTELGLDAEQEQKHYWDLLVAPSDREKEKAIFSEAVRGLEQGGRFELPVTSVHALPTTRGNTRRIAWSNAPFVNESGVIEAVTKIGVELGAEPVLTGSEMAVPVEAPARVAGKGGDSEAKVQALLEERDTFFKIPENAPFGVILLDAEGNRIYSNPQHKVVLGFSIEDAEDIEKWLERGCPDKSRVEEVLEEWRDTIWRKQLSRVFTLATEEGLIKEVEFRPKLLSDGSMLLTFSDVTEARRSEEALRSSEAKFRALFLDSVIGMALVDQTGFFFDINPALEKMLGLPRWQARRKAIVECIHADDLEKFEEMAEAVEGETGEGEEMELRLKTKEEGSLWARLNASPVRDGEGRLMFTAFSVRDLTAQRATRRELQDSQEQNRALLEAVPDLILLLDRKGKILDAIPPAKNPLGLQTDKMVTEGLGDMLPGLAEKLDEITAGAHGKPHDMVRVEFTAAEPGEAKLVHQMEARAVSCGEEQVLMMVEDVTERHLAQDVMTRQALVFDNIDEAIVITDLRGRIVDWNPSATGLFGFERDEMLGEPLFTLYDPDNPREFNQKLSRQINAERCWKGETKFRHKDGTEGICEVNYVPLREKGGASKALVGISRIPGEDSARVPDADGSPEAQNARRERSEVDRAHHMLRNHLQTVSSLLNLDINQVEDAKARFALRENQTRILAISFIYRQMPKSKDLHSVNFAEIVKALGMHLQKINEVDGERVALKVDFEEADLGAEKAVPLALISNELISNSLQHGFGDKDQGAIAVNLEREGDEVVFSVRDDGEGLPEKFDVKKPKTNGLKIVKILVEQLHGELEVAEGPGAEIRVRFPVEGG
ncbi:MAG: PAS domain S-box protein [Verrucomicrobiota bacterium]